MILSKLYKVLTIKKIYNSIYSACYQINNYMSQLNLNKIMNKAIKLIIYWIKRCKKPFKIESNRF